MNLTCERHAARTLKPYPVRVRAVIDAVPGSHIEMLELSDEAERLAAAYADRLRTGEREDGKRKRSGND